MALEEDILQKNFESEFQKLAVNILFTSNWLYSVNADRLKPFDITPEQFNVLRILRGSHPTALMLTDISVRMLDKSSNATRLVEKLRIKNLVKREICKDNRRQVDIFITTKGLDLLTRIEQSSDSWSKILKNVNKSEAKSLNEMLDRLRGSK